MTLSWIPKTMRKFLSHVANPGRRLRPKQPTRILRLETLEERNLMSASLPTPPDPGTQALNQIDHFVVIYQENWSFDSLYGNFPGANGLANAGATNLPSLVQVDRNGTLLAGQATFNDAYVKGAAGTLSNPPPPLVNGQPDPRFPAGLNTLLPYNAGAYIASGDKTGDIVHRFYQEQSQIDHGAQNKYVTWSDNPGLVMSNFDATNLPEGLLAQQYTMDDNFFHASFGGSFLNHQFLVAAAAPVYPNAATLDPGALPTLDANGQLALDANGKIVHDGSITPIGSPSFGDPGQTFTQNYAINTIFSKNLAPDFVGNNTSPTLLPSQNDSNPKDPTRPYIPTIGDTLDNAGVSWKYYAGGWDNALAGSPSNPANNGKTPANDPADPNFQWHHQPLAYYDNFAPWLPNGQRNPLSAAHLQDENNFFQDLGNNALPSVSFIKQIGANNEHPGYADLLQGQQATADLVHAIQNSPDWAHTAIIITYDENGGRWDHVAAPDANGKWGDGTRVPTIVISPYAKQGFVDHTQHDTLSILKTIEQRYNLPALNNLDAKASSLASNFQIKAHASIGSAYVQPDADNLGKFTLIVQGTEGNDKINVTRDSGALRVQIKGPNVNYDHYFSQPISRLEIYGQGGNDKITVAADVTVPALIFGGSGNDTIQAGGGATVAVGGTGNDTLIGGSGASILIGGGGADKLQAGSGSAILIGGTTDFDTNAIALRALLKEWSNPNETYLQKVNHLDGSVPGGQNELTTNTTYVLTSATVHADGTRNELKGFKPQSSTPTDAQLDLFFAHQSGHKKDDVDNLLPGEVSFAI